MSNKIKPIAIHLPQFHPFPENDEWWGKGFTEWTNVTKAKPLFKDHYQPHLPADLGFYDLRLEEARLAQIELAKKFGIYGFCYFHYWFNGKRLMEEPLDRMLKNPKEDFPFMLCWANENWTRRWDGQDADILIAQHYSIDDSIEHIEFLCKHFFSDKRYIKIGGKPFITIYKPLIIPDIKKMIAAWRKVAQKNGYDDLVIGFMNQDLSFKDSANCFDYTIDFQPNFDIMPRQKFAPIKDKILSKLGNKHSAFYNHKVVCYKDYVSKVMSLKYYRRKLIPGITPGWDNTARKKTNGFIFDDANPDDYTGWLKHIVDNFNCDQSFLFINAWNEWAEGNHLEPCQKWGSSYLKATKKVLDDFNNNLL